jgi:hypothetical protein
MTLKLRLAAIASTVTLVASLGLAFAWPAAAVNDVTMCANGLGGGTQCAVDTSPVTSNSSGSAWDVPTTHGQINSRGDGCMEISGTSVILAACDGLTSEEWTASSDGSGYYTLENDSDSLCLNDKYTKAQVNVTSCNGGTDEEWHI